MVNSMAMERFMVVLALSCVVVMLMPITAAAAFKCPTAFWVFGDSLTDTGNSQVAFPTQSKLSAPYGESYTFHDKPGRNRFSDGRLGIDFVGTQAQTSLLIVYDLFILATVAHLIYTIL